MEQLYIFNHVPEVCLASSPPRVELRDVELLTVAFVIVAIGVRRGFRPISQLVE